MKICVLGKRSSILGWVEGAVAAFRAAGHSVLHAVTRDPRLHPALERLSYAQALGAPRARALAGLIRRFAPDLLLAIDAWSLPLPLLQRLRATPGLPPLLGWVGDAFADYARDRAGAFAAVGYTDSGLIARHQAMGLPTEAFYLPHAANPTMAAVPGGARDPRLVFVANPTPQRMAVVGAMTVPVLLVGEGWRAVPRSIHEVHARRIGIAEVGAYYASHRAVLNIRNEHHVLAGLNQRSFDPYLCGAVVVSDAQPDLTRCFVPGEEVLVWHDAAELDALAADVAREPAWVAAIAARGRARVLAEHTYAARLQVLAGFADR